MKIDYINHEDPELNKILAEEKALKKAAEDAEREAHDPDSERKAHDASEKWEKFRDKHRNVFLGKRIG